jgi:hypothetical protein
MFRRVRRRTVEWRRVAQFEPVRVEGARVTQEEEVTDRPSGKATTQAGMRVALVREPENERDTKTVAVVSLDERTLGYLPAEVADWLAPLIDSGRATFDGRIYAVEPSDPESTTAPANFYLTLTQFELRPVERFSLAMALRRVLHLPARVASWFGREAAPYHAFSPRPLPPRDRFASDDSSGG